MNKSQKWIYTINKQTHSNALETTSKSLRNTSSIESVISLLTTDVCFSNRMCESWLSEVQLDSNTLNKLI